MELTRKEKLDKVIFNLKRKEENPHYQEWINKIKPVIEIGQQLELEIRHETKIAKSMLQEIKIDVELQKNQRLGERTDLRPQRKAVAKPQIIQPEPKPEPEEQVKEVIGDDELGLDELPDIDGLPDDEELQNLS